MCNCIRVVTRGHMGTRITLTTTKLTDRLTEVMTDLMADDVMKVSRAPNFACTKFSRRSGIEKWRPSRWECPRHRRP